MTKFLLYKERASQQICIGRFTDFYNIVLQALVDRWSTFGNSAFILRRSLRLRFSTLFNQESFTELKFSPTNSVYFS